MKIKSVRYHIEIVIGSLVYSVKVHQTLYETYSAYIGGVFVEEKQIESFHGTSSKDALTIAEIYDLFVVATKGKI